MAVPPSAIKNEVQDADNKMNFVDKSNRGSDKERDIMEGRTVHKDIPPAKDRILNYKRHTLGPQSLIGGSSSSRPTTANTSARPTTAVSK